MPVWNPKSNKRLSKTAAVHRCDGCGRVLPKGSAVLQWSVWRDGFRNRLRFCSGCRSIIYSCDGRRPLDCTDDLIVRDMCECCDSFPVCPMVQYLRESKPDDVWFGDLSG